MKEEGDAGWGQGAGCNGILYILLEPVTARMKKNLLRVKRHLDNRNPVLHIKKLEKNFTQTTSFLCRKDGRKHLVQIATHHLLQQMIGMGERAVFNFQIAPCSHMLIYINQNLV